jgi:ficolin
MFLLNLDDFVSAETSRKVDMLRDRLQRLETRLSEDLAMIREEFYLEIKSLPKTEEKGGNVIEDATHVSTQNFERELQTFQDLVSANLKLLHRGISDEKRLRREIQNELHCLKTTESENFDALLNVSQEIKDILVRTIGKEGSLTHIIKEQIDDLVNRIVTKDELNIVTNLLSELNENWVKEKASKTPERVVDCADWRRRGHVTSGVYSVFPEIIWRPLKVYCDMETNGGGWTVFQRRKDGSENFTRSWLDYSYGFGDLNVEFWLGNEFIHRLTSLAPQELRIELEDFDNDHRVAEYGVFSVGPANDWFKLTVESFSGNVTDSLIPGHHGQSFSTTDRGNSSSRQKLQGWLVVW